MTIDDFQPTEVKKRTILARIAFFDKGGDVERTIEFVPALQKAKANEVGHPHHTALLNGIIDYFGLFPRIDTYGWKEKPRPPTTDDINHPVQYNSALGVTRVEDTWTIILFSHNPRKQGQRTAFHEDDGAFAKALREDRSQVAADTKEAKKTAKPASERKPSVAKDKGPVDITVKDLPVEKKPKFFTIGNTKHPVKVFGKTHREKQEGGKRVIDPSQQRTAKDDSFTFAATAYQLGGVKKVFTSPKGVIIVGNEGVAILQTIRKGDKPEMEKVMATALKHGFKGDAAALPT